MREAHAAVLRRSGGPFRIEPVRLSPPRGDEVVVEVTATGMCHADILVRDQIMGPPPPVVLGHEGAGVVVERGRDVVGLELGDHVVLSFAYCGACIPCLTGEQAYCDHGLEMNWAAADPRGRQTLFDADGKPLQDQFFGQSSFATYAVVNQRNAIRVPMDAPLDRLGPLGCGVQTGAGAVLNTLKVTAGSRFVCFGAGAVGMSALLAAKLCGVAQAVMVDLNEERLDLATQLGATHTVRGEPADVLSQVRDLTGGGADFALDTTGSPPVVSIAIESLAVRGAIALVAGTAGAEAEFDIARLFSGGRSIRGVVEGDSVACVFIPQLVALHQQGRFPFDRLIRFYEFEEIDKAADDSLRGIAIKPVIRVGRWREDHAR